MLGKRVRSVIVAGAVLAVAGCYPIVVDQSGVYTDTSPQRITGHINVPEGESLHQVWVNGVQATLDGTNYQADVPLDGVAVVNPVVVTAYVGSRTLIERRTVVYADGEHATLADIDARVANAGGLRLNDSAFAKLSPAISAATPVVPTDVAGQGTSLFHYGCPTPFPCPGSMVSVYVDGPPTIGGLTVAVRGQTFSLAGEVVLTDVAIPVHMIAKLGSSWSECDGTATVDEIRAVGGYVTLPDGAAVDVNLASAITPTLTGFSPDGCTAGLEQTFPGAVAGAESALRSEVAYGFGDPDGSGPGDARLADGIEAALTGLVVEGPLPGADGISVDAVHSGAQPNAGGLLLRQDTGYRAGEPAAGALDLAESLAWGDDVPLFADTTPTGQPFDLAVGASTSGLNQLLAAHVERGFLTADIADPGGLEALASKPFRVTLRPEIAPVLRPDNSGTTAVGRLVLKGYRMALIGLDNGVPLLEVVLDVDTTVELLQGDPGLVLDIRPPAPADVEVTVAYNPLNTAVSTVQSAVANAAPAIFAQLPRALPAFALPTIPGAQQQTVEIARFGPNLVVYLNLQPAPGT